ncbi:MAG TPA: type I 3-dehydroquinate dehydratase [Casimicrobiaceae bacterium]|jgi:3-dehydroquinate dehydratase-1|nr:type I 3-dehydroquinate dehydratase [Casimicrobiaceae bacterium]
MAKAKPIALRGKLIAGGAMPVICTPLVGRTRDEVLAEMTAVLPKKPDVVEWRADFFAALADTELVVDTARALKAAADGVPLLFTRRTHEEGGERVALSEPRVVELYEAVCAARCADLVDYELSHPKEAFARVRDASRRHDVALVGSYHNFESTPSAAAIVAKFRDAQARAADVGKVAVMPSSPSDVLALLAATYEASGTLDIALISMSMGPVGSVSRMVGGVFGSALTFAVGKASSAPGQIPIEELRAVLATVRRAAGM